MFRNKSVDVHQFSLIPRAEIPRSQFRMETGHKTTFDAGYLVPIFVEEVLPGDTFNLQMTCFARLATPIFPIMDNLHLESFFFYVPTRLLWDNFKRFMGEQVLITDAISYTIPQAASPAGGFSADSLADHFGLPTAGQVAGGNIISVNALPFRAYNFIYNEWFRDQNLVSSVSGLSGGGGTGRHPTGDGPDALNNVGSGAMLRRGKRHDYFTSCLPWTQKGSPVSLPLTGNATVRTSSTPLVTAIVPALQMRRADNSNEVGTDLLFGNDAATNPDQTVAFALPASSGAKTPIYPSNLYADLSTVTSTTINALRLSFQTQRLLERDARGGTRYTEIVRSHFGVVSPDARLQRPEYLGGGTTMVNISPVPQTSNTPVSGTPQGNLSAFGTALAQGHGFRQSFTEHGYIIGLVSVRADLTYQQGMRRLWSRSTRYDFYMPVFANLGEQPVYNREIYCDGSAADSQVFGYQERWAEYRYHPALITGQFRSTYATPLDAWHLSQRFTALPTLNGTFIDDNPPIDRTIAVPSQPHFIADFFFSIKAARPMPMYSVPGMVDHF